MSAFDQIRYLRYELNLAVNRRWWRWLTIWFGKRPRPLKSMSDKFSKETAEAR